MANTIIALKKSSTPASAPSSLEFGELALNYADGKLYYKNVNSAIVEIAGSSQSDFATINANGTLIIADTPGDILTIEAGNNITIVGDAINDKITISATGVDISSAFNQANTARNHANAAFDQANTALNDSLAFAIALG